MLKKLTKNPPRQQTLPLTKNTLQKQNYENIKKIYIKMHIFVYFGLRCSGKNFKQEYLHHGCQHHGKLALSKKKRKWHYNLRTSVNIIIHRLLYYRIYIYIYIYIYI
ncbi:hypothetical protein LSH36_165g04036, partial [Paralvinella palmiformis]